MARLDYRLLAVTAVCGAITTVGATALAQPETGAKPAASGTGSASTDPTERARVHYERGLQLFNEENYDAALFEFDRAYELAPSYKILYNMGRIQRQQNNYAAAMRSYTRYLGEGGAAIPEDRRKEVENEIAVLKPRVAHVKVTVNVDDADVYADDTPVCTATIESTCVGKSPLPGAIIVNGGRHKITATKKGYAPATTLVSVVGSDEIAVKLDLVSYDKPAAPPKNPWIVPTIVGWSVTGAGFATALVTGILALKAKSDQEDTVARFSATRDEIDSAQHKTRVLSHVTDGLLIGAGVVGVASSYLTFRALRWKHQNADVQVGLGSVGLGGSF